MNKIRETEAFKAWFANLRDTRVRTRIDVRIKRLALGNPGDIGPVGEGISELRIHYGPGYRVYYKETGREIVVLLCGGDKSTQEADIAKAKRILEELENENI